MRDQRDFERHLAYCYFNPVKHGLVAAIEDWPHSTFHRDVREGHWHSREDMGGAFGERDPYCGCHRPDL